MGDTGSPGAALPPWEGKYRLVLVEGESLPALVDRRPGCSVQIVSGRLTLTTDRFYFTNAIRERCEGEELREDAFLAQGGYQLDGDALHFKTDSGMAFGSARATFDEGAIRLTQLATEGGPEEVDWLFSRFQRPPGARRE